MARNSVPALPLSVGRLLLCIRWAVHGTLQRHEWHSEPSPIFNLDATQTDARQRWHLPDRCTQSLRF